MKLARLIFAFFLLSLSTKLFAADQGEGFLSALTEHAQIVEDRAHLKGLIDASSLIHHVQLMSLFRQGRDYQFMTEARCRYGVSRGFLDILNETIGKIHDATVKAELSQLALELARTQRQHDPYDPPGCVQWPTDEEVCRKNSEKYRDLLVGANEVVRKIAQSHEERLPLEKKCMFCLIEMSRDAKPFGDNFVEQGLEMIKQRHALMGEVATLRQQQDDLRAQVGEMDGQAKKLRVVQEVLDEEIRTRRSHLASVNQDIDEKQATFAVEFKARREEAEQQMAKLESDVSKKAQEVSRFRVSFTKMVEESFAHPTEDRIEIEGIDKGDPLYAKMKASLGKQLECLQSDLDSTFIIELAKEEDAIPHRFILKIDKMEVVSSRFKKKKWRIQGLFSARVSYWNVAKSVASSVQAFKFYDDEGFSSDKNQLFEADLRDMLSEQIPNLKKIVYAQATSAGNRQFLSGVGATVLQENPVSSLMFEEENPEKLVPSP